jgi:hypothetical protein
MTALDAVESSSSSSSMSSLNRSRLEWRTGFGGFGVLLAARVVLHWGSCARKPRGVPVGLGLEHVQRFSLCCAADGCRTRKTPSSLCLLGHKVYLDAMVVPISAMQSGLSPARMQQLQELVVVSWRTIARWREWRRSVFTDSPFWRDYGAFVPPVATVDLPASLLKRFAENAEQQLILLLRFLRSPTFTFITPLIYGPSGGGTTRPTATLFTCVTPTIVRHAGAKGCSCIE